MDNTPELGDTEKAMQSTKAYFNKYEALLNAKVLATTNLLKTTEEYSAKLNEMQGALVSE